MNKKKVIGISGGIGSGKSLVSHFFEINGFPVFNSDNEAKKIYYKKSVKKRVIELLGKKSYNDEGSVNTKFVSDKIFSDDLVLKKLNEIIHPEVRKHFLDWCENQIGKEYVLQESALLFQNELNHYCYKTILVDAPEEVRVKRVMRRDKISEYDVLQKVKKQDNPKKFYALADLILINDNNELIMPQILNWMDKALHNTN